MRRISVLAVVVVVAVVFVAWGQIPGSGAQDATPGSAEALPEGVTIEVIAAGESAAAPSAPVTVSLLRFRLEPGAVSSVPAGDPSLALIYEETGTGIARLDAPVIVSRAGAAGTNGSQEAVADGTEFVLDPGDSFAWPPSVAGEVRNEGTEPATALVVLIAPQQAGPPTAATPTS